MTDRICTGARLGAWPGTAGGAVTPYRGALGTERSWDCRDPWMDVCIDGCMHTCMDFVAVAVPRKCCG